MQGTYQDPQGNYFIGSNPVTPEQYASHMAIMDTINKPQGQGGGLVLQHPDTVKKEAAAKQQAIAEQKAAQQGAAAAEWARRQNAWKNPVTEGIAGLGRLTGWY